MLRPTCSTSPASSCGATSPPVSDERVLRDRHRRRDRARGARGRLAARRDHHGLEVRHGHDGGRREGPGRSGHPARDAGDVRASRARHGRRLLQERADARAEGDHRRRRPVGRAAGRRRRPHRPPGHRRPALQPPQRGRRARRPVVGRPDAAGRARRVRRARQRQERRPPGGAHPLGMIARYTRPELGALWTDEARMEAWRRVEVACAEELDGPKAEDLEAIRGATFTVAAVQEREAITDHDVAAFVDVLASSAGPAGRWIHFGLTSSDVLDTALGLQLKAAGEGIAPAARAYADALAAQARAHVDTVCVGRTHGVHAEPTTFGVKLAGYAMEAYRNVERLERAFAQAATGAISGAVGTYASLGPDYEARVLARLGLRREEVSTQVVPRDRHAELLEAIALAGAGLERFATEIRHLQRTEVREVEEPFRAGKQKGSSAMPHKRNPITTERITGLARVLRGYAQTGLENVALWHERDISHSGAERVVLPDATILIHYMLGLGTRVASGMTVHVDRMRANIDLTSGALFSQRVLLALVESGMQRDDAYRIVQEDAQRAWDSGTPLRELLEARGVPIDLDRVFDLTAYTRHAAEIVARLPQATQRQVANSGASTASPAAETVSV